MPIFSLRRRLCGAPRTSAKSSSPPSLSSPPFPTCSCDAVVAHPLRVFCIPCVVVTPSTPCYCHCNSKPNHSQAEAPVASPLHVSASTTLTPANASSPAISLPSFMPTNPVPPRQTPRNAEQATASHRRPAATAAHNNSNGNPLSGIAPSSFLHDLNANMTVVLNLTDSSHPLQPAATYTPEAHVQTGRALTAVQPSNVYHPPRSEAEPSSYSSSESRDVLEDDSDITAETSYDSLVKQLQKTSPGAFSRALQAVKAPDLSVDSRNKLMHALENALRSFSIEGNSSSLPHTNVRIDAYTALATFYASSTSTEKEKAINYCQSGLDLATGLERLFPQLVANLHALKARVLVSIGDLSRITEAISHAKAAQIALYAINDPKLQYQVCVTLGDAYAVLIDGKTCDNICMACEWYTSAIQLSKMAALESPIKVMWLSCRVAQLTLRFLRHKRSSQTVKDGDQHGGRKGGALSNMTIPHLLNMVEQLRLDVEKLHEGDGKVSDQVRQLESVVYECVGRAYFERARTSSSKEQDLKKAASSMQKALSMCSWEAASSSQRYAGIQEMFDDIQTHLNTAEAISSQIKSRR